MSLTPTLGKRKQWTSKFKANFPHLQRQLQDSHRYRETLWEVRRQLCSIKEKGFLSWKPIAASGDQHGSLKPVLYKEVKEQSAILLPSDKLQFLRSLHFLNELCSKIQTFKRHSPHSYFRTVNICLFFTYTSIQYHRTIFPSLFCMF